MVLLKIGETLWIQCENKFHNKTNVRYTKLCYPLIEKVESIMPLKWNETKQNEMKLDESNKICKTHSKLSESWINCKNIFFFFTLFCILIDTAIAADLNIVLIWVGWHRNRFFIIRRFFHIFYIINLKTHININRRRTPYSKPNRQYSGDLNIYLDICTYQNPRNRTNLLFNVTSLYSANDCQHRIVWVS